MSTLLSYYNTLNVYLAKTIAYRDRTTSTAGVTLHDIEYVERAYKALEKLGIIDHLRHWHSASAAIYETNVAIAYSLDSNNLDADQVTLGKRPVWDNFTIVYDGGDWLDLPNNTLFDITAAISLEAWVNIPDTTGTKTMIAKFGDTSGADSYIIRIEGSKAVLYCNFAGTWSSLASVSTLAIDTDYHIVGTYDGANMKLYINKSLDASKAQSGSISVSSSRARIGRPGEAVTTEKFTGKMPSARIWATALAQTHIDELYNLK